MTDGLEEGTEITCPLCREETATVERNKRGKPYFYCREYEAAVNMNAPVAHSEQFLRQFVAGGRSTGGAGGEDDADGDAGDDHETAGSAGTGDIVRRDE